MNSDDSKNAQTPKHKPADEDQTLRPQAPKHSQSFTRCLAPTLERSVRPRWTRYKAVIGLVPKDLE
jgi:hypothetical protein